MHNNSKNRKPPVSFRASEPLEMALKEKAATMGISKSQLILMALDQFLEKQAKTPVA